MFPERLTRCLYTTFTLPYVETKHLESLSAISVCVRPALNILSMTYGMDCRLDLRQRTVTSFLTPANKTKNLVLKLLCANNSYNITHNKQ